MFDRQPSMNGHDVDDLNRFWNELLRPSGDPEAGGERLDPALTDTVRRFQALGAAPPPASSHERVRRAVSAAVQSRVTPNKEAPVSLAGFAELPRPAAGPTAASTPCSAHGPARASRPRA